MVHHSSFFKGFQSQGWTLGNVGKVEEGWHVAPLVEDGGLLIQGCLRAGNLVSVTTLGKTGFRQRVEKAVGDTLTWSEVGQVGGANATISIGLEQVRSEASAPPSAPGPTPYSNKQGAEFGNDGCSAHIERVFPAASHPHLLRALGNGHAFLSGFIGFSPDFSRHSADATLGVAGACGVEGLNLAMTAKASSPGKTKLTASVVLPEMPVSLLRSPMPCVCGVRLSVPMGGADGAPPGAPSLSLVAEVRPSPNVSLKAKLDTAARAFSVSSTLRKLGSIASFTPCIKFPLAGQGRPSIGVDLVTSI